MKKEKNLEVKCICNKCGEEFDSFYEDPITEIKVEFGYGSEFDTDTWKFNMCDNCLRELRESFVIPPKIIEECVYEDTIKDVY